MNNKCWASNVQGYKEKVIGQDLKRGKDRLDFKTYL